MNDKVTYCIKGHSFTRIRGGSLTLGYLTNPAKPRWTISPTHYTAQDLMAPIDAAYLLLTESKADGYLVIRIYDPDGDWFTCSPSPTRPIELLFDSSPMTFCSPEQLVEAIVLTNPSEVRLPDLDDDDDEDEPC